MRGDNDNNWKSLSLAEGYFLTVNRIVIHYNDSTVTTVPEDAEVTLSFDSPVAIPKMRG